MIHLPCSGSHYSHLSMTATSECNSGKKPCTQMGHCLLTGEKNFLAHSLVELPVEESQLLQLAAASAVLELFVQCLSSRTSVSNSTILVLRLLWCVGALRLLWVIFFFCLLFVHLCLQWKVKTWKHVTLFRISSTKRTLLFRATSTHQCKLTHVLMLVMWSTSNEHHWKWWLMYYLCMHSYARYEHLLLTLL